MNATLTESVVEAVERQEKQDEKHEFLAVLVYEDAVTLDRVQPIYERLIKEITHEGEFHCAWVAFGGLKNPEIATTMARNAAHADLVVFSAHAGQQLPEHVRNWIESWLPQKDLKESALAAFVGFPTDRRQNMAPIYEYLHAVADRCGMKFITDTASPTRLSATSSRLEMLIASANVAPSHWGINE